MNGIDSLCFDFHRGHLFKKASSDLKNKIKKDVSCKYGINDMTNHRHRKKHKNMSKRKVLLMGRHASGKSSMRAVIFNDTRALDTMYLHPTLGLETTQMHILGDLALNLWECGGQDTFLRQLL